MGFIIAADPQKLKAAAAKLGDLQATLEQRMTEADSQMSSLLGQWSGGDAEAFYKRWKRVSGDDSVYDALRQSMQTYAQFLQNAAVKYETAQMNACYRAAKLKV